MAIARLITLEEAARRLGYPVMDAKPVRSRDKSFRIA